VAYGACHYCGYCERCGCEVNAKASPHFTVIPLAAKKSNVEMRTNARVLKVNLDAAKNRAESVTYIDASGREFEQLGGIVILAAYALGNVRLMLWSGIGRPYDPVTGCRFMVKNLHHAGGSQGGWREPLRVTACPAGEAESAPCPTIGRGSRRYTSW
jgi:gluconate 2-dehydrogenase alpha chain